MNGPRMLVAALIIAGGLQLLLMVGQKVFLRTTVAKWGSVEHAVASEVLMIRNEKVLQAPIDGRAYALVKAGSRVRRGQAFLEIIGQGLAEQLTEENRRNLSDRSRRLARLEPTISGVQRELAERTTLRANLQRLNKTKELAELDKEMAGLRRDLVQLDKQRLALLNSPIDNVPIDWFQHYACFTAEEAGVFWPALDGGEERFTGLDAIPDLRAFNAYYKNRSPLLEQYVRQGQPVGKLVVGWEEMVVVRTPLAAAVLRPDPSRRCRLRLAKGQEVEVEFVHAISTEQSEFWLFRENSLDPALLQQRKFRAMIIPKQTVGIVVPRSAVWKKENEWVVFVPWKKQRKMTRVELVDADETWAVVRGIKLGTPVLYH